MNRQLLTLALVAAAAYLSWRWWQHQRFQAAIGTRVYDSLELLSPTITAPVITVPVPRLVL